MLPRPRKGSGERGPARPSPVPPPPPLGGQDAQDRPRPGPSTGVPAGTKQGRWVQTLEGMPRGDRQLGGAGTRHQFRAGTPIKGSRIRNLGTPMPTFCPSLLPLLAPPVPSGCLPNLSPILMAFSEPLPPRCCQGPSPLIGSLQGSPLLLSASCGGGGGGSSAPPLRRDFPGSLPLPGPPWGCTRSAPHLGPWPATGSRLHWRGDRELSRPGPQQHVGLGLQANIPRPRPASLQAPPTFRTQCWWGEQGPRGCTGVDLPLGSQGRVLGLVPHL